MSKPRSQPSPPPELRDFLELFANREFWESHEVLEAPWRDSRSGFYKGLILYASAFVHVQRGNPRGVAAQIDKTLRELAPYQPSHLGIDVAEIVRHCHRVRRMLESGVVVSDAMIPPPLEFQPELCRGDEPELMPGR